MRRTYISPEYTYTPLNGSFNMVEETSFFGSKMLNIANSVNILTENVIYYQQPTGEQINLVSDSTLLPIIFSTVSEKSSQQSIVMNKSQSQTQIDNNTNWIIQINIQTILEDYLFATLKKYRSFEGVMNNMTVYNNVDTAISEYISKNVIDRYAYFSLDFYVRYSSLVTSSNLRFQNNFSEDVETPAYLTTKVNPIVNATQTLLTLNYNQELPSTLYKFDYYFNIYFNKL